MNGGALQHPLESRRRLGILDPTGDQIGKFVVEIGGQLGAQFLDVDTAGPHHRHRILIFGQGQQQMLQRGVFVTPFIGVGEGPVKGLLEGT